MKRFCALLLSLMLCLSTAAANTLDGVFSPYLDGNSDVRFSMTAQIDSLVPYGESTVDMLNAALRSLSVSAALLTEETQMTLSVAGEPVMQLSERAAGSGTELACNLLPNRTLQSAGSAMDALLPAQEESGFDLFAAISEAQACYQQLTEAIRPYAEEKKANYKIQDVGSSRWSRVARLTAEQSAELAPLMIQLLSCGMDSAYREQLQDMQFAKSFVVALYQTEEGGEDLAVYMKGNVTLADGKSRKLAYQWAFADKEDARVHTYKFELTKSSAAKDSRTLSANVRLRADDALLLKGETSAAIRGADGNTVTTRWDYDLSGQAQEELRTVQGTASVAVKTTAGDDSVTETLTFTPDIRLVSSQGTGVLSGAVGIEQKTGKSPLMELTLLFGEESAAQLNSAVLFAVTEEAVPMPESSLTQNLAEPEERQPYLVGEPPIGYTAHSAPQEPAALDLDALSAQEREALADEWVQNLAGRLLIAFAQLPPEDSALIRDNLSDEDYAAFLSLIEGL